MNIGRAEIALSERDISGLCRELATLYPNDPGLKQLPDLVRFALVDGSSMPRLAGSDALFAASIAAARNFWRGPDSGARNSHRISRRVIGRDLDFLGDRQEMQDWTAARALNRLVLNEITPRRRAAVVGTMRDDGIYALEWIAHYLTLGFEGVFIYTNDNADGSERMLRCLADRGMITLIESETSGTVRPEVKAFDHSVHLLHDLRDYEWVLFVDSDEFFQPGSMYHHSITALLDDVAGRFGDRQPSAILYEWLWFNSGMIFEREPGLLMERFQYASPHWLTKPLVRLRDVVSMRLQHIPEIRQGGFVVNSVFEPINAEHAWEKREPRYEGGMIAHYWPKSFEEFSLKKARGDALKLDDDEYRRDFRLFFDWNGPETPDTFHPIDGAYLDAVKQKLQELRAVDGVAAAEAAVLGRFRTLLERYAAEGGLRQIYQRLKPSAAAFGVPTSA